MVALGEVGIGNTTVAAALAAGLLGVDPLPLIGLGTSSDSSILEAKRRAVVAAVRRYQGSDPLAALACLGGGELAVLAGAVLGVAGNGGVIVLDGMATGVAALVALELEAAVGAHLVAGQRSREAGHPVILGALGLEPILDLRLRAGEGAGAALAVSVLRAGLRIRAETARVRSPVGLVGRLGCAGRLGASGARVRRSVGRRAKWRVRKARTLLRSALGANALPARCRGLVLCPRFAGFGGGGSWCGRGRARPREGPRHA